MSIPLRTRFGQGILDALPIFFGYLSVGFAFGLCAITFGHPAWSPILMSATHISGTGQFAVINQLHSQGGIWEVVIAVVALNLRYVLMALSVAQRLEPNTGLARRLLIAMGVTDEIVGVAVRQPTIRFPYFIGLLACSYAGWLFGTSIAVSPIFQSLLPHTLIDCLGMALYAMFLALIIPGARASRPLLLCVALAATLSVILRLTCNLGGAWTTLISGVTAATVAAILFPKEPSPTKVP